MAGISVRDIVATAFKSNKELNVDNLTVTHSAPSTTVASTSLVSATASKTIQVYGLTMTAANTVKVTFNSTVGTTNTAVRALNMIAGVPIVLPVGKNGDEHFAPAASAALTVSLSAAVDTNITVKTKKE
jgi:hypothetical protein